MDSIKGHECSQHSELDNWLLEADIATFILNPREQRLGNFAQWKSDEVDMASSTEWTRQYQYENYRLEELQDWLIKEEMGNVSKILIDCLVETSLVGIQTSLTWYCGQNGFASTKLTTKMIVGKYWQTGSPMRKYGNVWVILTGCHWVISLVGIPTKTTWACGWNGDNKAGPKEISTKK